MSFHLRGVDKEKMCCRFTLSFHDTLSEKKREVSVGAVSPKRLAPTAPQLQLLRICGPALRGMRRIQRRTPRNKGPARRCAPSSCGSRVASSVRGRYFHFIVYEYEFMNHDDLKDWFLDAAPLADREEGSLTQARI